MVLKIVATSGSGIGMIISGEETIEITVLPTKKSKVSVSYGKRHREEPDLEIEPMVSVKGIWTDPRSSITVLW